MSIRIDVVNYALSLLGAEAITSIEDDAPEARVMRNFYYIARDSTLEEAEWTFAKKRFKPAESEIARVWGWSFAFPIPSDIIRVTRVDRNWIPLSNLSDNQYRNPSQHEVEGRVIVTNDEEIFCTGIRKIEDEGIYSSLFTEAFATKLAMLACLAITESNTKLQIYAATYEKLLRTAKTRDGMQNTTRRYRNTVLSRSRRG